jgi:hypothetical protein
MPPNLSKINEMTDTLTKAQRKLAGNCVYCDVAEGQNHDADCAVTLHQRLDKLERPLGQILYELRVAVMVVYKQSLVHTTVLVKR